MSSDPSRALCLAAIPLAVLLVGACSDTLTPSSDHPKEPLPNRYLLVANASIDFQSASFGAVALEPRRGLADLGPLHADSVVRVSGHMLFAINRFGGDNLQRLDPETLTTVWQRSVGPGSNPQDILVTSPRRAYVTRYDATELWVVDPGAGDDASFHIESIDLAGFADSDGLPEMAQMAEHDGIVYVALQRLSRQSGFIPIDDGLLVAIDGATGRIIETTPMPGANPIAIAPYEAEIWVACAGHYGQRDGALHRFDTRTGAWLAPVATEAEVGGDLAAFVPGDPAIVAVSDDGLDGHVRRVFLADGTVTPLLEQLPFVQDLAADQEHIYLLDRTPTDPGVRIFDRTDGRELTAAPIATGLPPWSIEIVHRSIR